MSVTDACRLCGAASRPRAGMTFGRFQLSRCAACGFQQISPEPNPQELDALYGALYFQKAKYTDPAAIQLEYRRRHALMARAGLNAGARILEIGCGAGQFMETRAKDYDWSGVDFSAAGIEAARARLPHLSQTALQAASIEQYTPDLSAGLFDAILIFDTIEHLYDPKPMLDRAATWLKPSGKIIVSTPDIGAPFARLLGRRWPFMTPPEHLTFFSQKALKAALDKTGLTTTHITSKGKFANLAFVIYKAGRVGLLPKVLGRWAAKMGLGKVTMYIPTGDVLYAIAVKRNL